MKRRKINAPSSCLVRVAFVVSVVVVVCPTAAYGATPLPAGCPKTVTNQKYPLVRMPNIVGQSVSTSKIAASVYESSERLAAVTTTEPAQQGKVAKQCPAADTVVNENPKTGVPGVTLWIYQYQLPQQPVTASVMITDSPDGVTPLWVLSPVGGPYWLRIAYTIPCGANVEDITARVSSASSNVNLASDNQGYLDEWSTESGGGPDGQQITCGTGRITANDIDPSPWLGDGAITFTIDAITEPPTGAPQLTTLAQLTLHFVQ